MVAYVSNTLASSGIWNNPLSWLPVGVPALGDSALIQANHTIEITANHSIGTDPNADMGGSPGAWTNADLIVYGLLKWADNPGANLTLLVQTNVVLDGATGGGLGRFRIGQSAGSPLPSNRTATVHFTSLAGYQYRMHIWHGEFVTHGAVAYHMADATSQRTKLTAAPTTISQSANQVAVADDGGALTTETVEANDATANDMTLLPAVPAMNDAYYWGDDGKFAKLVLNQGTAGAGTWTIYWEYYNGVAWNRILTPDGNNQSYAFKSSGTQTIEWQIPGDWIKTSVNGISAYWIRARVNSYSAVTTQPLGTQSWPYISDAPTISLDDAVDWSVGDELVVGQGGDKTAVMWTAPGPTQSGDWGIEKTTITGKTDASNYTLDSLAFDHQAGDFVIQLDRNIIIKGDAILRGFVIYVPNHSGTDDWVIDINWTKFQFIGRSSPPTTSAGFNINQAILTDGNLNIKDTVLDTCAGGQPPSLGRVLLMNDCTCKATTDLCDELHFVLAQEGILNNNCDGRFPYGHLSFIGIFETCVTNTSALDLQSFWSSNLARNPASANQYTFSGNAGTVRVYSGEHHCGAGVAEMSTGTTYDKFGGIFENIKAYHSRLRGITINSHALIFFIRNCEFYNGSVGIYIISDDNCMTIVENTSFDDCDTEASNTGAVVVASDMNMKFRNCTFGTVTRNFHNMIFTATAPWINNGGTCVFENCIIKEPTYSTAVAGPDWGIRQWIWWESNLDDYDDLSLWNRMCAYELADVQLLNSSGVNQWSTLFGTASRVIISGGRGEVHQEASTIIDNSFAIKLIPFSCVAEFSGTHYHPLEIPVDSGQTITVKLSLQKNTSLPTGRRPAIHLFGLGIDEESEMSNVNNSWEELTVSGTASVSGFVRFWVSGGYNTHDSSSLDNFLRSDPLGTVFAYADGLDVTIS